VADTNNTPEVRSLVGATSNEARRVGDTFRVTGHTGETSDGVFSTDSETQIRQVFRNLALTLAEVGASWSNVVEISSYNVGLVEQSEVPIRVAAEFLVPVTDRSLMASTSK
jgi:enamine deaminase RidA (YjgF/YER057c/UK114 family)